MNEQNQIRRKNKSPWRLYMAGEAGSSGYYIKTGTSKNIHFYGPFKNQKIAEFFNLIAFGDPRSLSVSDDVKNGIEKFDKQPGALSPNQLFGSNSKFSIWWMHIFDKPLTPDVLLKLAKATQAQGYQGFVKWLLNGSKLDGKHVMAPDN